MGKLAAGTCGACDANTWGFAAGDCAAQTVCGAQTDTTARLTGASITAKGTCEACDNVSWGGTAIAACTACTVDANAATAATYTCTSVADSQIVGSCKATFWKDTTGTADVCRAVTACSGATDRAIVVGAATDGSGTADNTCTACAANFWAAAGDNTACVAQTVCGFQAPVDGLRAVQRTSTGFASKIALNVCQACTSGTWATNAGNCVACDAVVGAKADAAYTCTSKTDSHVTGNNCLACAAKTAGVVASLGVVGTVDTCTMSCAAGSYRAAGDSGLCTDGGADANAAATGVTYTCTTGPGDRQMTGACAADFYLVETGTADRTCTPCAAGTFAPNGQTDCTACTIANADATANAVTYTCTSNADVRFATGGCAATHYKVAGLTADSCALITACGNQLAGACSARVEVDAPTATADRTCTPCAAGSYAAANGDCLAHTTCGDQVASPTVSPAAGSRLVGASGILAGTCAACTDGTYAAGAGDCAACTPVANSEGLTCTDATDSRVTACAATYGWTSGGAGHDTCVAACPCGKWAKTWTTGQPLRCVAVTACAGTNGAATPVTRVQVNAATATADRTCTPCATGFWAAVGDNTNCAAITACGNQHTCGARVEVDAATATADRTCTPCTDGTYAAANGNCGKCTAISGASAVTCTSNADSRTTACATQCPLKTSATADSCGPTCATGYWENTATCDMCTAVSNADGGVTCTSATTSQVTSGALTPVISLQ